MEIIHKIYPRMANSDGSADRKKGTDPRTFHEHVLSVTGFLGGITFAALVLIVQSSNLFVYDFPKEVPAWLKYSDILITLTALVSLLFIVSSVGNIRVAAGEKLGKFFPEYTAKLADAGFMITVIVLIPALIFPFSWWGAAILFTTSLFLLLGYLVSILLGKKR